MDSLSLYVLSFKPEMAAWPIGAQRLSSEESPTQAACSLPLDTSHPRSPRTLLHTGFHWDGMRSRRVLESYLLLGEKDIFMVGFRFLWENRTTFSREFLEFGRQRSAGTLVRGACGPHLPHHTPAPFLWLINQGGLLSQ